MIGHQISAVTEVYHRNFDTAVTSVQVIFLCDLSIGVFHEVHFSSTGRHPSDYIFRYF